jgi:hypothetical protein
VWSSPALIDTSAKINIEFFSKLYGFSDPEITLKPGDRADFIGVEKNGWCAGEYEVKKQIRYWYWDDDAMENYLKWTKQIAQGLNLPVVGWQISIGNMDNPNAANEANFANAWKDTFFPYFFGNVNKFVDAGFIGFLVGKGLAEGTDYTLPGDNFGEKGWFFSQLAEFDKGRPYYDKESEIPSVGISAAKNAVKNINSVNVSITGKNLNVILENQKSGAADISIYNVSGRKIYQTTVSQSTAISMNNFNSGVYFVKTEYGGRNFISKILLRQ